MNYIIHYDIAAVVLTLTIAFHYMVRHSVKTKALTTFIFMIVLQAASSVLDVVTALMIDKVIPVSDVSLYLWNMLYLIACNSITPLMVIYMLYVVKGAANNWSKADTFNVFVPYIISMLLIGTTPFSNLIFYITENGEYVHGVLFRALYIASIYYLVVVVLIVIRNRERMKTEQRIVIYFYIVATIITVVVQMFIPRLLIMMFAVSIAFFLVYLSLENPDDFMDSNLRIFNREGFVFSIRACLENRESFKLVGVYIPGVKHLNETIGEDNKSILLDDVAGFLCKQNGKKNVYRLSNSKFVIKLENDDDKEQQIINNIFERFQMPFQAKEISVPLIPSVAILSCPEDARTLDNVVELMDYSLNELVENKDMRVVHAGENIIAKKQRETRILQVLTNAVQNKEFEVYYQPIYSVQHQRYNCAEALLRLKKSDIGYISPDEFIPLAEKHGMILEIGEFVFRSVCEFIIDNKVWEKGIENIHINLSVVQCMQESLAETFLDIMKELGLPSHRVKLEVTETAAVVSSASLSSNMNALCEAGIMFALDDYGTGFSNTISLIEYPYSTIKIDKSVVWAAMEKEDAKKILKHTLAMIKSLDMSIVAEGVETYEQSEELVAMGCDYLQGYYYSKPITEGEFMELVSVDLKA